MEPHKVFESKISTRPSSQRRASPDLHPPSLLDDERNIKYILWTWPKQEVQPEVHSFQIALEQEGEGAWKDMPEITGKGKEALITAAVPEDAFHTGIWNMHS